MKPKPYFKEDAEKGHSVPWHRSECVIVNGYACIYTLPASHRQPYPHDVHLPGGKTVLLSDLRKRGWTVELPSRTRYADF